MESVSQGGLSVYGSEDFLIGNLSLWTYIERSKMQDKKVLIEVFYLE